MSTLTERDIERGTLIRHNGRSGVIIWDHPAVITQVDRSARTFRIRCLFGTLEPVVTHPFDIDASSPTSRKSMRVISKEEAREFVDRHINSLDDQVLRAKRDLESAEIERARFMTFASELGLIELK